MTANRRVWCVSLAKLVSPSFPEDAAKALCDMLPAFRHMPDGVFTEDTLVAVATSKRRQTIPSFDEIALVLNAARRELPVANALPPPDAPGLGPDDWQWVSFWHKRRAELFAADTGFQRGSRDADLANLDSLIRQQSRAAWHHIHGTSEPHRASPTAATIDAVSRALRPAFPQSSHNSLTTLPQKPAVRAAPVSDETLQRMRQARGVVVDNSCTVRSHNGTA